MIIYPKEGDTFIEGADLKEIKLEALQDVAAHSTRIYTSGVLSYKELSVSSSITALEPGKDRAVTKLLDKLDRGTTLEPSDKNSILVSYRLANDLNLDVGDVVTIAFESGSVKEYTVRGIIRTGNLDMDAATVIMNLDEALRQLGMDNRASVILVKLNDKNSAPEYRQKIAEELDISNVKTWQDESKIILSFTEAWTSFTVIITAVGLIAAAISVGLIIYINVIFKKRQIGVMKAIGAKDSFVFRVFVMEAVLFGLIGVALGVVAGYLGVRYMEAHPFYDPLMQAWISARFYDSIVYTAAGTSFAVTVLSGIYPAVRASRINIIQAIWGGG